MGDVLSVMVANCQPGVGDCGSSRPDTRLSDVNFAANTATLIAQAPLDASNQQILVELSHPTGGTDGVFGSFAYVNGGVQGP